MLCRKWRYQELSGHLTLYSARECGRAYIGIDNMPGMRFNDGPLQRCHLIIKVEKSRNKLSRDTT